MVKTYSNNIILSVIEKGFGMKLFIKEESHAIARKPCDAAAVRCGLKFTDIHYKFIQAHRVGTARHS